MEDFVVSLSSPYLSWYYLIRNVWNLFLLDFLVHFCDIAKCGVSRSIRVKNRNIHWKMRVNLPHKWCFGLSRKTKYYLKKKNSTGTHCELTIFFSPTEFFPSLCQSKTQLSWLTLTQTRRQSVSFYSIFYCSKIDSGINHFIETSHEDNVLEKYRQID